MKVLIACEFSGVVRDAFIERGHDAISCDLLPTERPGKHIQGDVLNILNDGWDLMIGHPPCTYISFAGNAFFDIEKYGENAVERIELRRKALEFFITLYNAPIPKICIENPVGYPNSVFRKPTQIIEPFYFGHNHRKRTCLWLKNLPRLNGLIEVAENKKAFYPEPLSVHKRKPGKNYKGGEIKKRYFSDVNTRDNGHKKSIFWEGIAKAMAEQWS